MTKNSFEAEVTFKTNLSIWYLTKYLTKYLTRCLTVNMVGSAVHLKAFLGLTDA